MSVFLGLGSNLGERRAHLAAAIRALEQAGVVIVRVSPVVESPAMLPPGAPPEWNRPFLNLVVECRTALAPERLLERIKKIEALLGRGDTGRWSPRPIDVDILLWDDLRMATAALTIPHPGLTQRSFVLAPLLALSPSLAVPEGGAKRTVLEHARNRTDHIALWMGIVNLTPDSFSDGGTLTGWTAIEAHVDRLRAAGAHIVDFGAESTRPGAAPLTASEELARLEPVLERVVSKLDARKLEPLVSVDTYHPETAQRALELGVAVINDVGGLESPEMIELAAAHAADWIAMHHVTIPADRARTLPSDADVCAEVERWLETRLEAWTRAGLDLDRIVFDPGIGFGKNPLQSLALLRNLERFKRYPLRVLVGHSRKSFMQSFVPPDLHERDLTTAGASLRLISQGVDILRVHDVAAHAAVYRGWAHLA